MKTLSIDIETYSSVSLQKAGVYRYVEAPDFEILLFGYSADGAPVQVIDLACGEKIPSEILDALTDDAVTKWAFNANFERICLSQHMKALGRQSSSLGRMRPLPQPGGLALHHDLVGYDGTAPLAGGCRCRARP